MGLTVDDQATMLGSIGSSIWYLKRAAKNVEPIDGGACMRLLEMDRFLSWPASTSKHHVWEGGLAQHTAEVLMLALGICDGADAADRPMNRDVITCASIFHDAGKIHDYDRVRRDRSSDGPVGLGADLRPIELPNTLWVKTEHFNLVHHVVKSSEMWDQLLWKEVDPAFSIAVKHCILAHHGRLDWGSPIVPKTREAWAVHLADMSSVHCIEERK